MEHNPMQFFVRDLEGLLDEARAAVAPWVGGAPDDLAFVPNATAAVNAVARSLDLGPGDELLTTDHAYAACRNALLFAAERAGARVVVAKVPFPLAHPDEVTAAILAAASPRTRLALVDHVTSPTGLVFPIESIVRALAERGIDTFVDAAHALGMVPCDVTRLGAAYWVSNAHKWFAAPKGTAVLHVRRDRQAVVRPTSISHGHTSRRPDRSRFLVEFDWTGTVDPTGPLCLPAAIEALEGLWPGGIAALRDRNRALALRMRDALCAHLGVAPPAPDAMIGALAAVPVPPGEGRGQSALDRDPLQEALAARGIEVPVVPWPAPPRRLLRVSAQAYVRWEHAERLLAALTELGACGA
jgi:isopenicillin-N epimerase